MILYIQDFFYNEHKEPRFALHRNPLIQKVLAEFAGTALFVFLGCSTVASATLAGAQQGIGQVALSWGMSLAVTIYCFASISGAHFNPAVSFAMYLRDPKSFGFLDMFWYIVAQCFGGFVAGWFTYCIYADFFEAAHEPGQPLSRKNIMGLAEFYPNPTAAGDNVKLSPGRAFFIEALGTAILLFVICAVTDPKQGTVSSTPGLIPLIIGLTLFALINITGALTMACFNPARELGPRLVAYIMFSGFEDQQWWIYEIAPMLGGPIGVMLYLIFLGPSLSAQKEKKQKTDETKYCLLSCSKDDVTEYGSTN